MQLFYTDVFVLPLPDGHRFPMAKYALLRAALLASGVFNAEDFLLPPAATIEELARAHDPAYISAVCTGQLSGKALKMIGFPWSEGMIERSRRSAGATLAACRSALTGHRVAANLAGGTHHAFRDRGEGFCVFNDAAIAALSMQAEGLANRILIVDLDVHQGNGTAAILRGISGIFTFSMHGARNYPFEKESSDLDIELPDGCADDVYLSLLENGLTTALDLANPDLVIYLAGADPYKDDRLGRLSLSKAGLEKRDLRVFEECRYRDLPLAIAMAGGYARQIEDTVEIHRQTLLLAKSVLAD